MRREIAGERRLYCRLMPPYQEPPAVAARVSTAADLDRITDIMATSFWDDPTWGPLFGEGDRCRATAGAVLGFMARSATRYPWVFISSGGESVSVWIPPGGEEMASYEHRPFERLIRDELGDGAAVVLETMELFEQAQPTDRPHFYLSLLGTHEDSRGRGIGMGLLTENLRRVDALHMPAYLESTNPVNDARYQRHGFEPMGSFTVPTGAVVTTMWREAR